MGVSCGDADRTVERRVGSENSPKPAAYTRGISSASSVVSKARERIAD